MTTFLISHARSGSQLIYNTLSEHSGLCVLVEPLCDVAEGYTDEMREILRDQFDVSLPAEGKIDTSEFRTPEYLQHVAGQSDFSKLDSEHKVIRLVRNNALAVSVSLALAYQTGVWHTAPNQKSPPYQQVEVSIERVRRVIRQQTQMRQIWWNCLTIDYEEMISDWPGVISRIQKCMGLPLIPMDQGLSKTVCKPLAELISNLDDVLASEFGDFLND